MSSITITVSGEVFTVSDSTHWDPSASAGFIMFKADAAPGTDLGGDAWNSDATGTYDSTLGTYTASKSTTVDGVAIGGEWVQLQTANTHTLVQYGIRPRGSASAPERTP